jgi:hypothetical protein
LQSPWRHLRGLQTAVGTPLNDNTRRHTKTLAPTVNGALARSQQLAAKTTGDLPCAVRTQGCKSAGGKRARRTPECWCRQREHGPLPNIAEGMNVHICAGCGEHKRAAENYTWNVGVWYGGKQQAISDVRVRSSPVFELFVKTQDWTVGPVRSSRLDRTGPQEDRDRSPVRSKTGLCQSGPT